jgi:hypothetical protein
MSSTKTMGAKYTPTMSMVALATPHHLQRFTEKTAQVCTTANLKS